jgi:hypothetical protein
MSPTTLLTVLVALALVGVLGQVAGGEAYACPVCGSRRDDGYQAECPWRSQ